MEGGIDEAGRGPVLGPLVVAGVAVPDVHALVALGVRDSKRLAPARRVRLARLIRAVPGVVVEVRVIEAGVLDAEMETASLNEIEARRFADIAACLVEAGTTRVMADAADVDAARFARRIAAGIGPGTTDGRGAGIGAQANGVQILAEHGADDRWPCVAAASIIAKTVRDDAIAVLAKRLERVLGRPMGSGYPGDAATQDYLRHWVDLHGDVPEGTRRAWSTTRRLLAPRQALLDDS